MGVSSISLWQQDQNYWSQQQNWDDANTAQNSLINVMAQAETNLSNGLSSIANQTALSRVNSQLVAAVQSALEAQGGSTLPSSGSGATAGTGASGSATAASSAATPTSSPASGTGKAPVTTGTALSTLGIPAGAALIVSAGGNTTTYSSTGSDTIGDLMSAINADLVGNAAVTASLNRDGELVITSKNDTDMVSIGGVYASNIGFGVGNDTFKPTTSSSSSGYSTGASSSTSSATAASSTSTTTGSQSTQAVSTLASQNLSTAASLLSASGAGGTLVDMLA